MNFFVNVSYEQLYKKYYKKNVLYEKHLTHRVRFIISNTKQHTAFQILNQETGNPAAGAECTVFIHALY